jgi:tetratricopeptide (TPR) repeat protein
MTTGPRRNELAPDHSVRPRRRDALRRWGNVAWPLLLLGAFLGSFRHDRGGAAVHSAAVDCVSPAELDARALEQCLAADAIDVELVTEAAGRAATAGDAARAAALYRRALSLDPDDGEIHRQLGEVLLASGDARGARAEAASAVAAEPGGEAAEDLLRRASAASQ